MRAYRQIVSVYTPYTPYKTSACPAMYVHTRLQRLLRTPYSVQAVNRQPSQSVWGRTGVLPITARWADAMQEHGGAVQMSHAGGGPTPSLQSAGVELRGQQEMEANSARQRHTHARIRSATEQCIITYRCTEYGVLRNMLRGSAECTGQQSKAGNISVQVPPSAGLGFRFPSIKGGDPPAASGPSVLCVAARVCCGLIVYIASQHWTDLPLASAGLPETTIDDATHAAAALSTGIYSVYGWAGGAAAVQQKLKI